MMFKVKQEFQIRFLLTIGLLVTMSLAFNLDMDSTLFIKDPSFAYKLKCRDYQGSVKYSMQGIASGINLYNDILLVNKDGIKAGYYPIKLVAQDSKGYKDQRIVVIVVPQNIKEGKGMDIILKAQQQKQRISTGYNIFSSSSNINQRLGNVINVNINSNSNIQNNNPSNQNSNISPQQKSQSLDINSILSKYGSQAIINQRTTTISNQQYTESTDYPTAEFPTKRYSNDAPNTQINNIINSQAKFSDADKNIITENDIRKNVILERSLTAQKSVANLLTIIQQAKANRNSALAQIQVYKDQYNAAIVNQRNFQAEILSGQNAVQKLNYAINGAQNQLINLQNKMKELQANRVQLLRNIQDNRDAIAQSQSNIDKLQKQLLKRQNDVKQFEVRLNKLQNQKTISNQTLKENQDKFNQIKRQLNQISNTKYQSKNKIDNLQNQIKDLEAKLVAAKNEAGAERQNYNKLLAFENSAPGVLQSLNSKIDSLQLSINEVDISITNIVKQLDSDNKIIIPALEKQIAKYQQIIDSSNQNIATLTRRINDQIDIPLQQGRQKYAQTKNDISIIKSQVSTFNENLRLLYIKGNDANTKVDYAKENLDAIILRESKQRKTIDDATLNLEKARSEKEVADLAVEELIASRTDALPYAIAPNGNGKTNPGNPNGNNPLGSPLGPLANNGGYNGAYVINDWTHYLSQAYGDGVNPAFSQSVNALYPFKLSDNLRNIYSTLNSNSIQQTKFPCSGSSNQNNQITSLEGTILEYGSSTIIAVDNKGYKNTIQIAPCTTILSNINGYKPSIGDPIVWRGYKDNQRNWKTDRVTCLRK